VPSTRHIRFIYKPLAFIAGLIPLALLTLALLELGSFTLGPNPVEEIQDTLGIWGIRFLMLTLAITPLRRLTGQVWLLRFRRMLGLFTFTYCGLHFLNYLVLDQTFNFSSIIEDIIERPFITVGFAAIVLMTPLAITSTSGWRRRLGVKWQKLHYLVYAIAVLACWHFFWQVKKDITEPMIYIGILGTLLGVRVWHKLKRSAAPASYQAGQTSNAPRK